MTNTSKSHIPDSRPLNFPMVLPASDGIVTIRLMEPADAEPYAAGTQDDLVKRFAHLPLERYTPQIVRDMIEGIIRTGLEDGSLAVLAIADAGNNGFLGSMVFFDTTSSDAEVGYWVLPEHRGRKISGRALSLACDIARSLGLKRLHARTVAENRASQHVLGAAGFQQTGDAEPDIAPSGQSTLSVRYGIELWPPSEQQGSG